MDLDSLTQRTSEWLRGTGPESDVVVSTRIRLARNLSEFPFSSRADESTRGQIQQMVSGALGDLAIPRRIEYVGVDDLDELSRLFLVERQLISRELADGVGPRGVAFSDSEDVSIMVNEEDHLRIQVIRSGLALVRQHRLQPWLHAEALHNTHAPMVGQPAPQQHQKCL